jgi:hypothetical protein
LTGKYGTSERPESGRLVDDPRYVDRYGLDIDFATADRFTEFAKKLEVKRDTRSGVDHVAPGCDRRHHRRPKPHAARGLPRGPGRRDDSDLREEICALSPAPPLATDRTETLKPNWA